MNSTTGDEPWHLYTEPYRLFRVEIPVSWRVHASESALAHGYQGRIWEGRRYHTHLFPPASGQDTRLMSVSIRIERYTAIPPPITKDVVEPTGLDFLHIYRVVHGADWLSCIVGSLRIQIQYEIQGISRAYHDEDWEPPPPLSPGERHERLALIQRIIDSFELLTPA
jgi:hypothetical protein